MWNNIIESDTSHMTIWRMRIVCCASEFTDAHSEHVTLVEFPTLKIVTRKSLSVKLHYISCLVLHNNNNYLRFLTTNNNKINPPYTTGFEAERQLKDLLHGHVQELPYSWL